MNTFDHERLHVYQLAVRFAAWAHGVIRGLPQGYGELGDQLRRASISIALNTAEGAGELFPREKSRFYRIAGRSGNECAAVLDLLVSTGGISAEKRSEGREMLLRIVSMHVKLTQAHRKRARTGTGTGTGTMSGTGTGTGTT